MKFGLLSIVFVILVSFGVRGGELALHYDAAKVKDKAIPDLSGNKNDLVLPGGVKVRTIKGRKVFQFNGVSSLIVKHSESIDPSMKPLSIEVTAEVQKFSNGVLAAMGGNQLGYSLAVQNGCVMFVVRADKKTFIVKSENAVSGWATITGRITADKELELLIDGKRIGRKPAMFIPKVPNDAMSIASDNGSSVIVPIVCNFAGYIKSVKVYSGE